MKLILPKILWKTLTLIGEVFAQWKTFLWYALILTSITGILGQWTFSCQINQASWWCYASNIKGIYIIYVLVLLLQIFLWSSFCCDISTQSKYQQQFDFLSFLKLNKEKLIKIVVILGSCLTFIAGPVICFTIVQKKANPDWRIEFMWFILAFASCWLPFLVLRCSAAISYLLDNGKMPSLKYVWQQTKDKNFSIIVPFCLLLLISNLLIIKVAMSIRSLLVEQNNVVTSFICEFINNLVILFIAAMLTMLLRAIQQIFLPENSSPSDESTAMDSLKNDITLPEAENDNSRVKKSAKKAKSVKSRKNKKEKK